MFLVNNLLNISTSNDKSFEW